MAEIGFGSAYFLCIVSLLVYTIPIELGVRTGMEIPWNCILCRYRWK